MIKITQKEFEKRSPLEKSSHPDYMMGEVLKTVQRVGSGKFLQGAKFQKDRESFIACLFTYAVRKRLKREWYIQLIDDDPPDFRILAPSDRSIKEKPINVIGVEIVEMRESTLDLATKNLERTKLTNYAPPSNTALLIFVNSEVLAQDLPALNLWIKNNLNKFSNFAKIYLLSLDKFSTANALEYTVIDAIDIRIEKCVLKDEFGKGIIYPHPLLDKFKVEIIDEIE